jgi:hypothetical protein
MDTPCGYRTGEGGEGLFDDNGGSRLLCLWNNRPRRTGVPTDEGGGAQRGATGNTMGPF